VTALARGPYIGLMSGTSLDAVDGLLVEFLEPPPQSNHCLSVNPLGFASRELDGALRDQLFALQAPGFDEIARAAQAGNALADLYAAVVADLQHQSGLPARAIVALGAHGQTVRHRPDQQYTIQLLAPARLAELTGIQVVADLRSADIAAGGQGAPLVPAFHAALFSMPGRRRASVNLGGIGNVTVLDGHGGVTGYDTGPANVLLDAWCQRHQSKRFDARGAWAGAGKIIPALLETLLGEPWFATAPPRSTGRDLFNLPWLEAHLQGTEAPIDVQATLMALTVESVRRACIEVDEIYLCGGGTANSALVNALAAACAPIPLDLTDRLHLPAQAVEAAAFAWLARERLLMRRAGRPAVTGARGERILGAVWPTPPR